MILYFVVILQNFMLQMNDFQHNRIISESELECFTLLKSYAK